MLYILYGEDDYSLQQYLDELKKSVGDVTVLALNTTVLEGAQVTVNQLRSVCEVVPFLAAKRLVIVNGLLERFDPKPKSGKGKSAASFGSAPSTSLLRLRSGQVGTSQDNPFGFAQDKPFSEYLPKVPESTLLVLVDGLPDKDKKARDKNPLLSELSNKAKLVTFPSLKDAQLRAWVQKRVAERGGAISPAAINLLARTVGGNLWVMSNEIDKLITFAAGRQIAEPDINRLVSEARETSIFGLVDAIVEFRADTAQGLLEKLLQKGTSPTHVLVMLARQVNFVVRAKDLKRQGKPTAEIRTLLNIAQEFLLSKALDQASRYSLERLKEVYHKLLETDLAIKTGKYEGDLALNMLVAELCQRPRQYA
jgi:DNA polymerase-3 subunit delta